MSQGGGEEVQTAVGGGAAGDFIEGLPGLRGTSGSIHLVQVYGTGYDGGRRRLDGGGGQTKKGTE